MGAHDFKHNKVPLFGRKPGNINNSRSPAPKLALVPASRYYCEVKSSKLNVCARIIRIERGSDGAHDFKLNKVPHFRLKTCEYQCFKVCCSKQALVPANCYDCDMN